MRKSITDVKVGDEVTVWGGGFRGEIRRIKPVMKVTTTQIKLEDGSVWNAKNGYMWGSRNDGRWSSPDRIERTEETDHKTLSKQMCVRRLDAMDRKWTDLDVEVLEAIVKLLPGEEE